MKNLTHKHRFVSVAVLALLLAMIIPATALGQGRGRRWGNKCGVFVNCHDARDGRLDGRGPRGDRIGNIVVRNRRFRARHRNFERRLWWQRRNR